MAESLACTVDDKKKRTTWRKFESLYIDTEKNTSVSVFPFFREPPDERDSQLLKETVVRTPFDTHVHNNVGDAWNVLAEALSKKIDKGGALLFPFGISGKAAGDRFRNIVNFMKDKLDEPPWRIGIDDNNVTNFMKLAENAVELHRDSKKVRKEDKEKSAAEKQKERDQAEVMKKASLGSLTPSELQALTTGNASNRGKKSESKAKTTRSSFGDISETVNTTTDAFKIRHEAKKLKVQAQIELKKKQQELHESNLSLERDRLQVEKADRDAQREQDVLDRVARRDQDILDREASRKVQLEQTKMFNTMVQLLQQHQQKNSWPRQRRFSGGNSSANEKNKST